MKGLSISSFPERRPSAILDGWGRELFSLLPTGFASGTRPLSHLGSTNPRGVLAIMTVTVRHPLCTVSTRRSGLPDIDRGQPWFCERGEDLRSSGSGSLNLPLALTTKS